MMKRWFSSTSALGISLVLSGHPEAAEASAMGVATRSAAFLPFTGSTLGCSRPLPPLTFNQTAADAKNPVVVVGGTAAPELIYLLLLGRLHGDNYNTYFFELQGRGFIDIDHNAGSLADCVDTVLAHTKKSKVHLIGHSQGGLAARAYIRDQGPGKVDTMISLGVPHTGTDIAKAEATFIITLLNLTMTPPETNTLRRNSAKQMGAGNPWLDTINWPSNDSIFYTNIVTTMDQLVMGEYSFAGKSIRRGLMPDMMCTKNPSACNVVVQNQCQAPNLHSLVDHIGLASDGAVYSGVKAALEHRSEISLNCAAL